jgi:signal transduction histidine kinase
MTRLEATATPSAAAPAEPRLAGDWVAAEAPEIGPQVATEQMRMLFAHTTTGTLVATGFALVLAAHVQTRMAPAYLLFWVLLKIGVAVPRILQAQLFRLQGRPGSQGWQDWTVALLALDGAVWGLGGAWMMHVADPELVAVIAASLCSVAAVATFGLQVRFAATAAYVVPMIAPTAISLLLRGDQLGAFAGVSLPLFLGLLLATARRSERRLAEVFTLRFLTDRIAAERQQALELAERQSRVKTRFLATMSHELRTPLHGILGLTRLIRAEHADATLRHRLGLIEHSGEHLLQIINDLLDLSRIEAGRIELHAAPFDLLGELEELVDIYFVRCQERGIGFSAELDLDAPCHLVGDATRLRQVLHNLLGNAVKFTERGEVRLRARRQASDCEFTVSDSGPGIEAADLPHIFDAFTQSGRGGGSSVVGVGLGLNISREIALAMNGRLEVSSRMGEGATFTLTVPLPRLESGPPPVAAAPRMAEDHRLPERVLLAEDNEVNALVVQAMLERYHCHVTHVADGQAAWLHATQAGTRPDIVLMDCQMPVLDGIEATRRIREAERREGWPPVPVVALTANSSNEDRQSCEEAGMNGFLSKPFTAEELHGVLVATTARR